MKLSSTGALAASSTSSIRRGRLKVAEHAGVFGAMTDLWSASYACCHPLFEHPYGPFDGKQGYMYINRVCYRVPDAISQRQRVPRSRGRCSAR
ncbi:hypothetical protein PINS_up023025 [Pythium insidiosum]|nr:hypothetical protein PINS_up023025 [Pythium insidiosum]